MARIERKSLAQQIAEQRQWIAAQLGISERTIYRDVAALKRAGLPIKGERGVGYMLRPRVRQFQDWKRGL